MGEVPGEYCPGAWSVNARGATKLVGIGQRLVAGGAHVGVGRGGATARRRLRDLLVPVYEALELEWDPATVGSVEEEVGAIALETVEEAILAEVAKSWRLVPGELGPEVLERAERLERGQNRRMRILAFSDLHCDLAGAARLVEASREVDLVIAAGDFASVHSGLEETIDALRPIEHADAPRARQQRDARTTCAAVCERWEAATVLHGEGTEIDGVSFWGLGAGIPITPWDWSFDLDEQEAAVMLEGLTEGMVLIVHSPPFGHVDASSAGDHLGSRAILQAIEAPGPGAGRLRAHSRELGRGITGRADANPQSRAVRQDPHRRRVGGMWPAGVLLPSPATDNSCP